MLSPSNHPQSLSTAADPRGNVVHCVTSNSRDNELTLLYDLERVKTLVFRSDTPDSLPKPPIKVEFQILQRLDDKSRELCYRHILRIIEHELVCHVKKDKWDAVRACCNLLVRLGEETLGRVDISDRTLIDFQRVLLRSLVGLVQTSSTVEEQTRYLSKAIDLVQLKVQSSGIRLRDEVLRTLENALALAKIGKRATLSDLPSSYQLTSRQIPDSGSAKGTSIGVRTHSLDIIFPTELNQQAIEPETTRLRVALSMGDEEQAIRSLAILKSKTVSLDIVGQPLDIISLVIPENGIKLSLGLRILVLEWTAKQLPLSEDDVLTIIEFLSHQDLNTLKYAPEVYSTITAQIDDVMECLLEKDHPREIRERILEARVQFHSRILASAKEDTEAESGSLSALSSLVVSLNTLLTDHYDGASTARICRRAIWLSVDCFKPLLVKGTPFEEIISYHNVLLKAVDKVIRDEPELAVKQSYLEHTIDRAGDIIRYCRDHDLLSGVHDLVEGVEQISARHDLCCSRVSHLCTIILKSPHIGLIGINYRNRAIHGYMHYLLSHEESAYTGRFCKQLASLLYGLGEPSAGRMISRLSISYFAIKFFLRLSERTEDPSLSKTCFKYARFAWKQSNSLFAKAYGGHLDARKNVGREVDLIRNYLRDTRALFEA